MILMIFMKEVIILILLKIIYLSYFILVEVHEDYHGPGDTMTRLDMTY